MDNKDMPAMPVFYLSEDRDGSYTLEHEGGLTKREYIATAAMQGILATPASADDSYINIAKASVVMADALLSALEEEHGG